MHSLQQYLGATSANATKKPSQQVNKHACNRSVCILPSHGTHASCMSEIKDMQEKIKISAHLRCSIESCWDARAVCSWNLPGLQSPVPPSLPHSPADGMLLHSESYFQTCLCPRCTCMSTAVFLTDATEPRIAESTTCCGAVGFCTFGCVDCKFCNAACKQTADRI